MSKGDCMTFLSKFLLCLMIVSIQYFHAADHTVPYESIIAREYNRMQGGTRVYTTIEAILEQSVRGKTSAEKNQIMVDLLTLQHALTFALSQAENDGKRLWYWGYFWKDTNAAIEILKDYKADVAQKIADIEWQSSSDWYKFFWISLKYSTFFVAGVMSIYLSQHYLNYQHYVDTHQHGLGELLFAPVQHAAVVGEKGLTSSWKGMQQLAAYMLRGSEYMHEQGESVSNDQKSNKKSQSPVQDKISVEPSDAKQDQNPSKNNLQEPVNKPVNFEVPTFALDPTTVNNLALSTGVLLGKK